MGLCDELELKLRKGREDSEKLMETVVKGLLEGAPRLKNNNRVVNIFPKNQIRCLEPVFSPSEARASPKKQKEQ
jgi:type I restriction enzyme S subunit